MRALVFGGAGYIGSVVARHPADVDDLARAHLLAIEGTTDPGHRIFNLGTGAGFSVREVVDAARLVTGCQIPAVETERRPGDPAVLIAASDLIRHRLGWMPEKSGLEEMVGDAWTWMRRRRSTAADQTLVRRPSG